MALSLAVAAPSCVAGDGLAAVREKGMGFALMAGRMPAPLDQAQRRRHKWRNRVQSLLLIAGMLALLSACVAIIFGPESIPWVLLGGGLGLLFGPRASPRMVLAMYGARRLSPGQIPEIHGILAQLARRAGLARIPEIHYVPSPTLNALAVGSRDESAIALTDGILRTLDLRELAGVLAHEVSHIRNNDLWVMGLADTISRLTSILAFAGTMLLIVALPVLLSAGDGLPLLAALLLMSSPMLGSLLQLALSRSREYDADLDAAGLTGDPRGLATALLKLERYQGRFWEELVMPGRRMPVPSLLRTHPPTDERVRRLLSLYGEAESRPFPTGQGVAPPLGLVPSGGRPRWHRTGAGY